MSAPHPALSFSWGSPAAIRGVGKAWCQLSIRQPAHRLPGARGQISRHVGEHALFRQVQLAVDELLWAALGARRLVARLPGRVLRGLRQPLFHVPALLEALRRHHRRQLVHRPAHAQ